MKLGEWLALYRKEHGMSMQDIADKIGVSKAYIGQLELGKNPVTGKEIAPRITTLQKIAVGLGIGTLDDLFRVLNNEDQPVIVDPTSARDYKNQPYYIDEETARIANEMKENPGRRVLFDASRKLSPESIKEVQNYIEFLYQKQDGSNDD